MTEKNLESSVRYPSDLSDEEWEILQPIFEKLEPYTTGRPRKADLREILNAIFYLNKTGCPWRYLPTDFPSYKLVNYYYNKWTENRMLEKVNGALRQRFREKKDRNRDPTGAIIDSQSVKGTPESGVDSGFDGGKLVKGRKRHIIVDTIGCLLVVWVHAATRVRRQSRPSGDNKFIPPCPYCENNLGRLRLFRRRSVGLGFSSV